MNKRILPNPETFASCPQDGSILDYYSDHFESVYVLLSPFFRPISDILDHPKSDCQPAKHDVIEGMEPVQWHEVLKISGLQSIAEIDIALRTVAGGLRRDFLSPRLAQVLVDSIEACGVLCPDEGDLSPLLENKILSALQGIGEDWLWIGDEFCTKRALHWIDDLKNGDEIPAHGCAFTPRKDLLITTHWDSHFSFLCSSKEKIEKVLEIEELEGFFCTPTTEVYWSIDR